MGKKVIKSKIVKGLDGHKLNGLDGHKSDYQKLVGLNGQKSNGIDATKEISEVKKSVGIIIVEIIEYIPNSIVSKTIIKKSTGNISVMSFDSGEGLTEKTSPFDTFAQIIDGRAEIVIDGKSNILQCGEGIVIPAHRSNFVKANERFKMILTIIKSGYE